MGNDCKYNYLVKLKHGNSANKRVVLDLVLHTAPNIWWKKWRQSQMALLSSGNRSWEAKHLCLYVVLEIETFEMSFW